MSKTAGIATRFLKLRNLLRFHFQMFGECRERFFLNAADLSLFDASDRLGIEIWFKIFPPKSALFSETPKGSPKRAIFLQTLLRKFASVVRIVFVEEGIGRRFVLTKLDCLPAVDD